MSDLMFHDDLPMVDNLRVIHVWSTDLDTEQRPSGHYYIRTNLAEEKVRDNIAEFIAYAWAHRDKIFYIRDEFGPAPRAAMMFALAPYRNCYFPESWRPYLGDARAYIEKYHG